MDENGKVGNFLLPLTEGNEKRRCLNVAEVEIERRCEKQKGVGEGSKEAWVEEEKEEEEEEEEEEETEKGRREAEELILQNLIRYLFTTLTPVPKLIIILSIF